MDPGFFHGAINSKSYVKLILSPFFDQLTADEKWYGHFMQDNAIAHTANNSMDALAYVFTKWVLS
jgi:hypothetical protein